MRRIRAQKKARCRREGPREDVKVPTEVCQRTKKKLESSAELIKKIEALLKNAAAKIQEAERLIQPFRYWPQASNCEGRMIDLWPRR